MKKPVRSLRSRLAVGLVVAMALVGLLLVVLDWQKVQRILGETDWKLVPAALLFTAISYACLSFVFATANRIFGIRMSWRDLSAIGFVSTTLNYLISAGGAAGYSVRFLLMRGRGAATRDIVAASVFNSYLEILGMLVMLPIGLGHLFLKHTLHQPATVAVGVAAILLVALFLAATGVIFARSLRTRVLSGLAKVLRWLTRRDLSGALQDLGATMSRGVHAVQAQPWSLVLMIALVAVDWAASVAALWFCFDALGDPISPGVLLTGFSLGVTAGALSMVPGGLGVQEGSMAGLYALLGVPLEKAVLASILFRLVYYLVPFLVSLVFYWRLLRQQGRTLPEPGAPNE
jgi:uncharacterized protein (TIRG00374 family)